MNQAVFSTEQVQIVSNSSDLLHHQFNGQMNAICWSRSLEGDYKEIVDKLTLKEEITIVSMEDLLALKLTDEGAKARDQVLADWRLLKEFGAQPTLNLLKAYERDEELDFISTDVYSFHVDRSPVPTNTFLCTYFGAASDILPNDQVEQKILIPKVRKQLMELHDGPESEFEDFLKEYFFDLHYHPKVGAVPTNLGIGNLWKLAVDHPQQKALPCVHRAPRENEGELRLLLIC